MKSGLLGAMAVVFVGAGWAAAQAPAPPATGKPAAYSPAGSGGTVYAPAAADAAPHPVSAPQAGPGDPVLPAGACDGGPGGGCQLYFGADYLLWKVRNTTIPTTASVLPVGVLAVDTTDLQTTNLTQAGVPGGTPTTGFVPALIRSSAVFPNGNSIDAGTHSGGRFTGGFWADSDQTWGLEASFFVLERLGTDFTATSGNNVNQFLVNTGFSQSLFQIVPAMAGTPQSQTLLSSFPVFFVRQATSMLTGNSSNQLWGAEINGRCGTIHFGCLTLGGLIGFRYVDFHEDLALDGNLRLFQPPGLPPTQADTIDPTTGTRALSSDLSFLTHDSIKTFNHFYGGQIGGVADLCYGNCFLNLRWKIGMGDMHQMAQIDNSTMIINNDPASRAPASGTSAGGLLTSPLDNGQHSRDRIAWVPEVNLKIGYNITSCLRATVGYDFLLVTNVLRPGDQTGTANINTTVTLANTNVINVTQPTFRFKDSDLWAQGFNFGLEFRY
jgi:hypothetical protein